MTHELPLRIGARRATDVEILDAKGRVVCLVKGETVSASKLTASAIVQAVNQTPATILEAFT